MDNKDLILTILAVRLEHAYLSIRCFLKKGEPVNVHKLLKTHYSAANAAESLVSQGDGIASQTGIAPLKTTHTQVERHESPLALVGFCFEGNATELHLFEYGEWGSIPLTAKSLKSVA